MRVYYPLISDLYGTSPSSITSPAITSLALVRIILLLTLIPQEFTMLNCLPRAEQPRVELDLEITAGSYNAKVNLPGVLQLNFN